MWHENVLFTKQYFQQVLLDILYPKQHHNSNDTSNKLKNVMKLQEVEELLSGHASIIRNQTETEP